MHSADFQPNILIIIMLISSRNDLITNIPYTWIFLWSKIFANLHNVLNIFAI